MESKIIKLSLPPHFLPTYLKKLSSIMAFVVVRRKEAINSQRPKIKGNEQQKMNFLMD